MQKRTYKTPAEKRSARIVLAIKWQDAITRRMNYSPTVILKLSELTDTEFNILINLINKAENEKPRNSKQRSRR